MEMPDSHNIAEQYTAYRRGLVLGLTMAEVGILIIFVLLLLIGVEERRRATKASQMQGSKIVRAEHLDALEQSDAQLTSLRTALKVANTASAEEIHRLIRVVQEVADTPKGQTTLQEARAAVEEMHRVEERLKKEGGSDSLAKEVELQSDRLANREGQLQRYESQLKEAGLGKGERPCWVTPEGVIEYLYDVVLESDGIRMREYHYDHRERERALLHIPAVDPTEVLSRAEFLRRTLPLYDQSLADNCRFFVVVFDGTGPNEKEIYKGMLRTVEDHFYKRLDLGPTPF